MYREIAKLILYGDMDKDCILFQFGEIFRRFEEKTGTKPALVKDIYTQLKRLLIVATDYGFNHNLWHNYLTLSGDERKSVQHHLREGGRQ